MSPGARDPDVCGVVVTGDGRGRGLGWPTANLRPHAAAPLADGVYAAWARFSPDWTPRQATVSIGANPTFDDVTEQRVEAHVHDADLVLYGRHAALWLERRIRPMEAFASPDELRAAMARDVAVARQLLRSAAPPAWPRMPPIGDVHKE
jgi:riboflavin kinase